MRLKMWQRLLALTCLGTTAAALNCTAVGAALCLADARCAAFGVLGQRIQLHGCKSVIANSDWAITIRSGATFATLPGTHNINETSCATHPWSGMEHDCAAPPPPPPGPPLYSKRGALDVGTYENTIFYWQQRLLNVENIACSYTEHAGIWDASWGNHSYARIRDLESGAVIANISSTRGFGFLSALTDYDTGTLWLFGTPADRCLGNGDATSVQAWWSTDPALQVWSTALAFDYGKHTYNVQVVKVAPPPGLPAPQTARLAAAVAERTAAAGLPPHKYAMFLEEFAWAINAGDDLTTGWVLLNNTRQPEGAPAGGPMMLYNGYDQFYYILTGGNTVHLYRTQDFFNWVESSPSPFIFPSEDDAAVAPFSDFPARALYRGAPSNLHVGVPEPGPQRPYNPWWMGPNWTAWVHNSNDGDMARLAPLAAPPRCIFFFLPLPPHTLHSQCCMHANVSTSYIVWGASTQGRPPGPPLDGNDAGTNSLGTAAMPLHELLANYFPAR